MMKSEFLTLRANLLGGMNDYILNVIGDDNITEVWQTEAVPDECSEDELIEIADDDELWGSICYLFGNLIAGYARK